MINVFINNFNFFVVQFHYMIKAYYYICYVVPLTMHLKFSYFFVFFIHFFHYNVIFVPHQFDSFDSGEKLIYLLLNSSAVISAICCSLMNHFISPSIFSMLFQNCLSRIFNFSTSVSILGNSCLNFGMNFQCFSQLLYQLFLQLLLSLSS